MNKNFEATLTNAIALVTDDHPSIDPAVITAFCWGYLLGDPRNNLIHQYWALPSPEEVRDVFDAALPIMPDEFNR